MQVLKLLEAALEAGASDLHLSAGLPPLIRCDGDMQQLPLPSLDAAEVSALIIGLMDAPQKRVFEAGGEVDFAYAASGLARFRVNAFHHLRGVAAALRAIPTRVPPLESLALGDVLHDICRAANGLVLVTGATGSGKSTTQAAMIDFINRDRKGHILTIEDPIEFLHESRNCLVHQRDAARHTRSFAKALRAALREDPDVIVVGEMRDQETISLALTAAETGHLVFGTLHTPSAPQTVNRIIDVFPAGEQAMVRSMLAESLQAVLAQTLVKRQGGGRVAAFEIMVGTPAVRNLVREDKVAQLRSAIQSGRVHGMQTRDQHLQRLAADGLIAVEAIERPG